MYGYLLTSAWREIRRFPGISALIVLAIAMGLAATMSSATIVWQLGQDPIPSKSDKLHFVMVDAWDKGGYNARFDPPDQVTFPDAMALWENGIVAKQAPMYQIMLAIQPDRLDVPSSFEMGRATSRHFIEMFDYPLLSGTTWSEQEERDGALVALISQKLSQKLFGSDDPLGKELQASGERYRIIGVFDQPKRLVSFHDVTQGALGREEAFLLPIRTAVRLETDTAGNNNCWKASEGAGFAGKLSGDCVWLQLWAQFDQPAEKLAYQNWMDNYAAAQKKLGRFPRTAANNRLLPVREHLALQDITGSDNRLAAWIGWGFLLVSVVNATCLLLAKFLRGARTSAIHSALGAARKQVFQLHLFQAMLLGLLSAALGTALTWLSLFLMRTVAPRLEKVAVLEPGVFAALIGVSLLAVLLAGLVPAWRVSRLPIAQSLRTN
jgi:putative ABC transport system permease protein